MDLIVETDLGRDPDDFFALCYLVSAGVNIRAITISPGDFDQIGLAKFFCREVGLDIPIGAGKKGRTKSSVGGVHVSLMKKYQAEVRVHPDGYGPDIIRDTHKKYPDAEFFSIGPLQSVGKYIHPDEPATFLSIKRATMQGGFIGYHTHGQEVPRLDKFEGLSTCATFNLGGDTRGGIAYATCKRIRERNWIGKNICHTIVYDAEIHRRVLAVQPHDRAGELLREGMGLYLNRHKEKKFHDPTAAVCMLHPEIATWVKARPYYEKGKWGCYLDEEADNVCINVDENRLWEHIAMGN